MEAKKHVRAGQYEGAAKLLNGLEARVTDDNLLILIKIEKLRIKINTRQECENELDMLIDLSKNMDFTKGLAETLYLSIHYHIMGENYSKALDIIKESNLIDLYGKLGDIRGLGNFFVSKSLISLVQDDLAASESEISKSLQLFKKIDDLNGQISCYLMQGRINEKKGDINAAIISFRTALTEAYKSGNKTVIQESTKFLDRLESLSQKKKTKKKRKTTRKKISKASKRSKKS